jgi:peptidyl-prolyl cis-trans isomerase C
MNTNSARTTAVPHVNGVVIAYPQESLTEDELRQRACSELLRQSAIQMGLLADSDPQPLGGNMTEAASQAIEVLLDRELQPQELSEQACRRYFASHASRFAVGERVRARHILLAVTPRVDVQALRARAEALWVLVRSQEGSDLSNGEAFAQQALAWSNCPSSAQGGDLGWLLAGDCMPEFAAEIFGRSEVGVLPRLVRTRLGFHVVQVVQREAGQQPAFESVRSAITLALQQQAFANALQHYLRDLAAQSRVAGVRWDT